MTLPEPFLEYIRSVPELAPLERGLAGEPEVSVRLNEAKGARAGGDRVPWCPEGRYLPSRPAFTMDPAMHQGRYYVQDASSMAIAAVASCLAAGHPVRYLDACAAPGGKTTAAAAALPAGSVIIANEYDPRRAEVLTENVAKWGHPSVAVSQGPTDRFTALEGAFDIIAVDAPCSGEGMMRKEAAAAAQWSPALVESCAALQREIIDNLWPALRPGGYMIYSTCTFNLREDEDCARHLIADLGAEPVAIPALDACAEIAPGIGIAAPCYRFLPGRVRGEGLFLIVVRKPGDGPAAPLRAAKTAAKGAAKRRADKAPALPQELVKQAAAWLDGDFVLTVRGDSLWALPAHAAPLAAALESRLRLISPGARVADVKGSDLVPAQGLALSQSLRRGAFPEAEVDYPSAVAYLRGEALMLPEGTPRGYVLLTYDGHPLGFVKNLGSRANNLYPRPWRILSQLPPGVTAPTVLAPSLV